MEISFVDHAPKVYVAGISTPYGGIEDYLETIATEWRRTGDFEVWDPEEIIEVAGRVCYASWHNPADKTRQQYIRSSIINHAHGSVLEHVWINLLIQDLPRSTQLELVRHGEGTAFSFESTRFTDKRLRFVIPPRMRGNDPLVTAFMSQCQAAATTYTLLRDAVILEHEDGTLKKKRSKEMARAVLPNCLGSDGLVSLNARALRWIIQSRSDPHADLSIREFAYGLFMAAGPFLPSVLSDATVLPQPDGIPAVSFEQPKV